MSLGLGQAKHYYIFDSNTDIYYEDVFSLAAFCKEKHLSESCMRDVSKGRQKYQHKGFYCVEKCSCSRAIIKHKINGKWFETIVTRFNKVKKPFSIKIRYNRTEGYQNFVDNINDYYNILHISQRLSCDEIGRLYNKDSETIRKLFINNNLERKNNPIGNKSQPEEQLRQFLLDITGKEFNNTWEVIPPLEIDCFNKDLKIGFEYCGLYWHSEKYKRNWYHYQKYKSCLKQDIKLITIFEHEWINRKEQVQDFIRGLFGLFKKRIYARDCIIKPVDNCKQFIEDNHIQGFNKSLNAFGLYYQDKLVGCVTYSKHHRNSEKYCLNRLVFAKGIQVVGGASKLIKNSIKQLPTEEIVTWSDNRWSTGKLYEQCGFVFDGVVSPDYIYYNNKENIVRSKQSMMKSKTQCPSDKTGHKWALENGWVRVYDCGKKRWKFKKEEKVKDKK